MEWRKWHLHLDLCSPVQIHNSKITNQLFHPILFPSLYTTHQFPLFPKYTQTSLKASWIPHNCALFSRSNVRNGMPSKVGFTRLSKENHLTQPAEMIQPFYMNIRAIIFNSNQNSINVLALSMQHKFSYLSHLSKYKGTLQL